MQTRAAFTMLELIFVLVILGILASFAIPRISASRDDARLVALKNDINTLKHSLPAYFLSQGKGNFHNAIELSQSNWEIEDYHLKSVLKGQNDAPCIELKLLDANHQIPTNLDGITMLEISSQTAQNKSGTLCEKLVFALNLNSSQSIPLLSAGIEF